MVFLTIFYRLDFLITWIDIPSKDIK